MTVKELKESTMDKFHALNSNDDGTLKNPNDNSYMTWYRANREMLADMERAEKFADIKQIRAFANQTGYTDVEPFEVIRVISGKCVVIREMDSKELKWKRDWSVGGFAGHLNNQPDQKWEITSNEKRPVFRIRFSNPKKGYTTWKDSHGNKYRMNDNAIKFYDYNF